MNEVKIIKPIQPEENEYFIAVTRPNKKEFHVSFLGTTLSYPTRKEANAAAAAIAMFAGPIHDALNYRNHINAVKHDVMMSVYLSSDSDSGSGA